MFLHCNQYAKSVSNLICFKMLFIQWEPNETNCLFSFHVVIKTIKLLLLNL